MKKKIGILGATGSVGASTLEVIKAFPHRFDVVLLTAFRSKEALAKAALAYQPGWVVIGTRQDAEWLRNELPPNINVLCGDAGLANAIESCGADLMLCAIVGAAGLEPTMKAISMGCDIGLANKEAMVVAGSFMTHAAREKSVEILPVDSEHNALHQCLRGEAHDEVSRLVLTASGGPFRDYKGSFDEITPKQALAHPTWSMGPKITVDSATMMNKGLEVIEAHHLFSFSAEKIDTVIHPQSIVHSLIETVDGSYKCQLGRTDMCDPIQYVLTYPTRRETPFETLDITKGLSLDFHPVDRKRFPCVQLAYDALSMGGAAPAVLNAANEVAVACFLNGKIKFTDIPRLNRLCLEKKGHIQAVDFTELIEIDREVRKLAAQWVEAGI